MIDSTPKRTCTKCKVEKRLDEFYTHSSGKDGHMNTCIECYKQQQKDRRKRPDYHKKSKNEAQTETEGLVIARLFREGIFAAPGKSSQWHWIDVTAWGCVKVEVKSSNLMGSGYQFMFTPKQISKQFQSDIICLLCMNGNDVSYHLFPSDHQVFFLPNGKRKRGLGYDPLSTIRKNGYRFGISLDTPLMNQHKDNWSLIETVRNRIQLEIRNEVYDADKSVLNFYSQKKLAGF